MHLSKTDYTAALGTERFFCYNKSMSDVSKEELQATLDGICKYVKKRRNYLAQDLYRQMHRSDCLGTFGDIYAHNKNYDVQIHLKRRRHHGNNN